MLLPNVLSMDDGPFEIKLSLGPHVLLLNYLLPIFEAYIFTIAINTGS